MRYLSDGEHRRRFLAAVRATGLSLEELWLRYFGLGGDAGKIEIDAYLSGLAPLSSLQHDLLAHAINERLDEIAPPRAPYAEELVRPTEPTPSEAGDDVDAGGGQGSEPGAGSSDASGE
ncbi:hypothetical protein [Rhodococcus sp. NPDC003383]